MNTLPSRYDHDCDCCIYLGQHKEFDLYVCPKRNVISTVIARRSSEAADYASGLEVGLLVPPSNDKALRTVPSWVARREALRRALLNLMELPTHFKASVAEEITRQFKYGKKVRFE